MLSCLVVGCGGFLGAAARYLIGLLPVKTGSGFPVKTFLINIIGSFVIGIIAAFAAKHREVSPNLVLFLKVGICGGFTTFSSFALETSDLIKAGNVVTAVLYACLSLMAGVLAVVLGEILVR